MKKFWLPLIVVCLFAPPLSSCGSKSPTSPSNTPPPSATPTKIISLNGNLAFGDIQVGQSFTATLEIRNSGNAALTVTGLTASGGIGSSLAASWTEGTIAPGASQMVTIRFSPTSATSYSGTLTVAGDHTSGTNTISISGTGSLNGLPIFTRSATGDNVLTGMPSYVTRVRVIGTYTARSSNFIMRVNNRLIVNELIGTTWGTTRYEGVLNLPAGAGDIEVTNSSGVAWSITEVR